MISISTLFVLVACSSQYYNYDQSGIPQNLYSTIPQGAEEYDEFLENNFIATSDMPVSTFSSDVDTAAYSIIRRKLMDGKLPNTNAVRIEEMINYFHYYLPSPEGTDPIRIVAELGTAPWNENHRLVMIGLKTPPIDFSQAVPNNLVFLLDVSGSMNSADKLPLLKTAIRLLVGQLREVDKISIVVYAGAAGVILDGGDITNKNAILDAIDSLQAGGSTAGGAGINLAYQIAAKHYIEGGNNRVILGTDGDFNVGVTSTVGLEQLIVQKRQSGIFLSVLGFGVGNLKDNTMERLANKGNGVYHYIDSILEAKKVFMEELGASLITVAKDVKLQIEFNPLHVKGYRLIGYENRLLDYEDFDNDDVDAGDMGAGHEVIALYEIIPADSDEVIPSVVATLPDQLKYDGTNFENELLSISIRYKEADSDRSNLIQTTLSAIISETPSDTFSFAACVAEFGMLLRNSAFQGNASFSSVIARATPLANDDYRDEFLLLVQKAHQLSDK
jgi:Ca-activated chloride channel family protein